MRKPDFAHAKTKAQISALVFTTQIVQSLFFLNPELHCFCDSTGQFVSDLVGNPEDRWVFSQRGSNHNKYTNATKQYHRKYSSLTKVGPFFFKFSFTSLSRLFQLI